jgi:outer membrane protein assembly factor BamB
VIWQADLPGQGQSAPAVWGDRAYLTAALDGGRERAVMGIDLRDGRIAWQQSAWSGEPEPSHAMNGWASPMCATDGEVVIAFFGKGGLHGYAPNGDRLWSRDLGSFDGPWGTAASPIIAGNLVVQNCDSDGEAFLLAVDKQSGADVWRTPRDRIRGWSTPILAPRAEGPPELVLNGHHAVRAYDLATGRGTWHCKSFNGRGEPVPAYDDERFYVVNGLRGDVYAIRRDASAVGDVTASHLAWHTPRQSGRDLPSPMLLGDVLLVMDMKGVLTAYDCADGREQWSERCDGTFCASPLAAGGRAYFINEAGETTVVAAGQVKAGQGKAAIVATNHLSTDSDEVFRATPIAVEGKLYIRSTKRLYCIGRGAA